MLNEEFIRGIKLHNEQLVQALLKSQEKKSNQSIKDWKSNPIFYIIIMIVLSFFTNYFERKINYDDNCQVQTALMQKDINNTMEVVNGLTKECEEIKKNFTTLEKILLVIRIKLSDDKEEKTWKEMIEEYEKESKHRGVQIDSTYSFVPIFIFNKKKAIAKI